MGAVGTESTQAGGQLAWKNSARLADGREIIYFDESPGLNRALARDRREGLAPVPAPGAWSPESPEQAVRWDPLLGEWVVIAAQRQDRTFLPPPDQCPLDPSAPGRPTEIPANSYDVVVFENRFPSLRGASALPGTEAADQIRPPRTSRRGTRRRSPTPSRGRSSACTFRFSPSAARPASSSTWPGPSRAWAYGSTTSCRKPRHADYGRQDEAARHGRRGIHRQRGRRLADRGRPRCHGAR